MFAGLSAFPLTPMDERGIDEVNLPRPLRPLDDAGRHRLEQVLATVRVPR